MQDGKSCFDVAPNGDIALVLHSFAEEFPSNEVSAATTSTSSSQGNMLFISSSHHNSALLAWPTFSLTMTFPYPCQEAMRCPQRQHQQRQEAIEWGSVCGCLMKRPRTAANALCPFRSYSVGSITAEVSFAPTHPFILLNGHFSFYCVHEGERY